MTVKMMEKKPEVSCLMLEGVDNEKLARHMFLEIAENMSKSSSPVSYLEVVSKSDYKSRTIKTSDMETSLRNLGDLYSITALSLDQYGKRNRNFPLSAICLQNDDVYQGRINMIFYCRKSVEEILVVADRYCRNSIFSYVFCMNLACSPLLYFFGLPLVQDKKTGINCDFANFSRVERWQELINSGALRCDLPRDLYQYNYYPWAFGKKLIKFINGKQAGVIANRVSVSEVGGKIRIDIDERFAAILREASGSSNFFSASQ